MDRHFMCIYKDFDLTYSIITFEPRIPRDLEWVREPLVVPLRRHVEVDGAPALVGHAHGLAARVALLMETI